MRSESARDPKAEHAKITDQRPPRIGECRRSVFFDENMTGPGESVSGDGHEKQSCGFVKKPKSEQQYHQTCAHVVQPPGQRFAVFLKIKGPKRIIRGESSCHAIPQNALFLSSFIHRFSCVHKALKVLKRATHER